MKKRQTRLWETGLSTAGSPNYGERRRLRRTAALCWLSALLLGSCLGCSNSDGKQALNGSVTLGGQPLKEGSISFLSFGSEKKSTTGGAIIDGAYSIPAEQGLVAGTYIVSISAADMSDATPEGLPSNGQYFPSLIPPEFNEANHKVEVTAAGPNTFSFDIPKSK